MPAARAPAPACAKATSSPPSTAQRSTTRPASTSASAPRAPTKPSPSPSCATGRSQTINARVQSLPGDAEGNGDDHRTGSVRGGRRSPALNPAAGRPPGRRPLRQRRHRHRRRAAAMRPGPTASSPATWSRQINGRPVRDIAAIRRGARGSEVTIQRQGRRHDRPGQLHGLARLDRRSDRPAVAERVLQTAVAVAPELVGQRDGPARRRRRGRGSTIRRRRRPEGAGSRDFGTTSTSPPYSGNSSDSITSRR